MKKIKFNIYLKAIIGTAIFLSSCVKLYSIDFNSKNIYQEHNICMMNDSGSTSFFIVPQSNKSLICRIENNKINELGSIPESIDSKCIVVNDEYICCINSSISIYDIKGKLLKTLKTNFSPKSLNSKNNVVYLGGISNNDRQNPGEIFAIIDLDDKNFTLNEIKLPINISYGKAIDDVLVLNDKLILVDDIIYPKYLIEYNISNPGKPVHVLTKELDNNGTYEHIIKGDINNDWMVLLSSTVGRGGSSDHIVIEGKTVGHLMSVRRFSLSDDDSKKEKAETLKDLCLVDKFLYVLINSTVYSLDLEKTISRDAMSKIKTKLNTVKKIIRSPDNRIILIGTDDGYELY